VCRAVAHRVDVDGTLVINRSARQSNASAGNLQGSTRRVAAISAIHAAIHGALGIVRSVDLSRRDRHASRSDDPRARHIVIERGRRERGSTRELEPNSVRSHIVGTPFLAEIRIMSFNFPPRGWAQCNGQFLPINQNQALFSLLGTMYGGNGQTTFALPDLRGRVPMHTDNNAGFVQGQLGGEAAHTVTVSELPTHTHDVMALGAAGSSSTPSGNRLAVDNNLYAAAANQVTLVASAVSNIGGSQAHENRQPFLALMFCIAITGIFPSQN
jgi:microcystin-dependent protein